MDRRGGTFGCGCFGHLEAQAASVVAASALLRSSIPVAFVGAQIFSRLQRRPPLRRHAPGARPVMAATADEFDFEWSDPKTNVRCRAREGGRGWARPGALSSTSDILPLRPIPSHCATSLSWGESPTTPQRHPGARGGDGRGKVRLLRDHP